MYVELETEDKVLISFPCPILDFAGCEPVPTLPLTTDHSFTACKIAHFINFK